MKIPFTTEQFFGIFERYNIAVFPAQWIILLLGIASLVLLHSRVQSKSKIIGCFLGLLWIWIGTVYHIAFFSEIAKPAFGFGALFIIEGTLLLINALRGKLVFDYTGRPKDKVGYLFVLFALIIYPVIGYLIEGSMDRIIVMGLPCPSTIFTFGFLLFTSRSFPRFLLIIPSIWAVIGLGAAINFGVYQDWMLLISAVVADIVSFRKKKNQL